MTDLLRSLLGLDTIAWGEEGVRFGFERPIPAWGWLLVVLGAVALAMWSYRRLTGGRLARVSLAGVRALLLATLVFLLAGPQLVRTVESVEQDWVVVLVDRSASMTIADVDTLDGSRGPREQQLRQAIQQTWPQWRELSDNRTVVWMGFDGGTYDLATNASDSGALDSVDLGDPAGRRTAIGAALEQALRRAAARPLAAVVVISDGRSADEPARAALRRLQAENVPLHAVALGSPEPIGDVAVRRVDAPRSAFVGDVAPVRVQIERVGGSGAAGALVRLVDRATEQVLDEQRVDFETGDEGAQDTTLTLLHRPDDPGASTWAVEVIPDVPDLIEGNNTTEVAVELVDRPMRVLYIDGYPRWEQRYLRNLLYRERSVLSSSIMIAANRRYTQEGNIEIDALPDSPERWAEYDVIVMGDVRPDVFTDDQLALLRDHIAVRGAGLVWIGGASQTPDAWWGSPLADLLPFVRSQEGTLTLEEPFVITPTPAADRMGIMRLADDAATPWPMVLTDPDVGWSTLYWGQFLSPALVKPTAEVLAEAELIFSSSRAPLVLSMRYGAGRSIYVATDETWRYRYAIGEVLFERFWLQIMRMLGRESLARSGRRAILDAAPRRAVVEQPVRVSVELIDQSLLDLALPSIVVSLERRPDIGEATQDDDIEMTLRPERGDPRRYSAIWRPAQPGLWSITAEEAALAADDLATTVEVSLPDDELRAPETDHALLARMAAQTDGKVFTPRALSELFAPANIPNRQVRLLNETAEPIWDSPAALILVLVLLTTEWVGRRVIRLI